MQISRKTIYAVRGLVYISALKDKGLCTITEVAEHENVPREFLAKILKELNNKGFVQSFKGVKGGYKLAKPRNEISFWDILTALQGPFAREGEFDVKNSKGVYGGAVHAFWLDFDKLFTEKLASMTLDKIDYDKFYPPDKN